MNKVRIKTNISPRAISKIELNTIDQYIDWNHINNIFHPTKKHRGRKKTYTYDKMLKLCKLQDMLRISDDTQMAQIIRENESFQRFCGFSTMKTPSHDTISRFKREISFHTLFRILEYIDIRLKELDFFEEDQLCIDGTDIKLNPESPISTWGAKSNKKKFSGIWLLTINSTKTEVIRDFVIGTAKAGQIQLFYKLLKKLDHSRVAKCEYIIADGIFDNEKSYRLIKKSLKKTPVIRYNPRKSKIKDQSSLPNNNWRSKYTNILKNSSEFKKLFKTRTSVERENSRLKTMSLIKNMESKTFRCPKTSSKWIVTQIILSIISINLSTLAQHTYNTEKSISTQTTLTELCAIV